MLNLLTVGFIDWILSSIGKPCGLISSAEGAKCSSVDDISWWTISKSSSLLGLMLLSFSSLTNGFFVTGVPSIKPLVIGSSEFDFEWISVMGDPLILSTNGSFWSVVSNIDSGRSTSSRWISGNVLLSSVNCSCDSSRSSLSGSCSSVSFCEESWWSILSFNCSNSSFWVSNFSSGKSWTSGSVGWSIWISDLSSCCSSGLISSGLGLTGGIIIFGVREPFGVFTGGFFTFLSLVFDWTRACVVAIGGVGVYL